MKRFTKALICTIIMVMLIVPTMVQAADTPQIKSISFTNATIDEDFDPDKLEYSITLEDPETPPTLEAYKVKGKGDIFITYNEDEAKHQTGIIATLEYDTGSIVYTFNYSNPPEYKISSNNNLKSVECELCEVYPALDSEHTDYKLYVPSDMTEVKLTAVPEDTSAIVEVLPSQLTLAPDQEPTITVTVTASDASTKEYTFEIKRLKKDTQEVDAQIKSGGEDTSIVEGELFYQKPEFLMIAGGTAGGLLLLIIIVALIKKAARKADDDDEEDFFLYDPALDNKNDETDSTEDNTEEAEDQITENAEETEEAEEQADEAEADDNSEEENEDNE